MPQDGVGVVVVTRCEASGHGCEGGTWWETCLRCQQSRPHPEGGTCRGGKAKGPAAPSWLSFTCLSDVVQEQQAGVSGLSTEGKSEGAAAMDVPPSAGKQFCAQGMQLSGADSGAHRAPVFSRFGYILGGMNWCKSHIICGGV